MAAMPLRWKGLGRKPIPEEWHQIGPRVAPNSKRNRDATHPINAMLNYGYAVLESQVQMTVVAAGLDPTIGFMHAPGERRSALVLDLMEPMRPVVDLVVLGLVRSNTFSPTDFVLREDGVCRVSPQLARNLVGFVADRVRDLRSVHDLKTVMFTSETVHIGASPCHGGILRGLAWWSLVARRAPKIDLNQCP